MEPTQVRLTIPDSVDPMVLMGPADSLLRRVEASFDAMVSVRGNQVSVSGPADVVDQVTSVFSRLIRLVEAGESPSTTDVDLLVDHVRHGAARLDLASDDILLTYRGRAIRPKTAGQKRYVDSIRKNTITFGIGPAGTGKTYLAMAMAVAALKRREVGRIVLARPVVEAGESLGFLPGDLQQKLSPYLRPLYDAMEYVLHPQQIKRLEDTGTIEVAPLAYMRGRSVNNAVMILDEAQNASRSQMKMFLTRLGENSQAIVSGDPSQIDLSRRSESGLEEAASLLGGIEGISVIRFTHSDTIRSRIVRDIVRAYSEGNDEEQ